MSIYATIIDRTVYFSLSHLTPRQFPRHAYTARYSLLLPVLSPTSYNSGHKLFADSEFSVHGNGEANVSRGHPSMSLVYLYLAQDLWKYSNRIPFEALWFSHEIIQMQLSPRRNFVFSFITNSNLESITVYFNVLLIYSIIIRNFILTSDVWMRWKIYTYISNV